MEVKASLAKRISLSMASFIAEYDKSSSDVAAYIEQRLMPLWRLAGEVASEMHDAWARVGDDMKPDHPDVRYAEGYEAGIKDAVKVVKAELEAIAKDDRKLRKSDPEREQSVRILTIFNARGDQTETNHVEQETEEGEDGDDRHR